MLCARGALSGAKSPLLIKGCRAELKIEFASVHVYSGSVRILFHGTAPARLQGH